MRFEEQGLVDRDFWVEAGKAGVIGIETPAELGGWGKDFYTHCIAMEEQFQAGVPGNFLGQSDLVLPYIAHYGTPEQCEKYVLSVLIFGPVPYTVEWRTLIADMGKLKGIGVLKL